MNELGDANLPALRADSRRSPAELAELVGLSQPACWRRVQRLRETGVIRGEVAILDGPTQPAAALSNARARPPGLTRVKAAAAAT